MKLIGAKAIKMKKLFLFSILFIGFLSYAQESPVSISTNTTSIKIGEQIQYKVTVKGQNNIVFPTIKLDSLKKVELVEALPTDTLKNQLEKKYLLTSFDSGVYVIPQQEILINNSKYLTDSLLINVATVKVDTLKQKMYEIKAVKSEPKTFDDYKHLLWWLLIILAIIGVALYFIFRKKKEKEVIIYVAPIQEAFQRLKELDEKQLLQQNKVKIYYSELTDIVRTYIEKDIHIPALESTTNELIETINDFNESSNLGISKETIQQLKRVLQSADLVKFAKSNPIVEEIKADRNTVELILKDTQIAVHKNDSVEVESNIENATQTTIKPVKKKKNNIVKYILIGVAALLLIISVLGYFGYKYVKDNVLGSTTSEILDKQWYTSNYGFPEVTIETPELLKLESVQLPESVMTIVGDYTIYTYGSLISDFYVAVNSTNFLKETDNLDMDGGVQGSLKEMGQSMGTIFSNYEEETITNNGVEGRKVTVNYQRKSLLTSKLTDYKLTMLFFADNKSMRQVIVSNIKDDASANKISERIINSVIIKP
ncbi:hypothetical protein SAMN04488006_1266 [Lutibacter maritimus]|uniref:LPXTG-motif cell wall anchor domain-containing protein n=2 Tax=Lutibacter maritimus TaxID=593133 RepID=A0A1I6PQM3_9FLAO|nr:hypothetical protein SAMN04488006_1266 [Lutibacter maritimus]